MNSDLSREQSGRMAGLMREQLNEMMAAADELSTLLEGSEKGQEYLAVLNRGLYRQLRLARRLSLFYSLNSSDEVRLQLRPVDLVELCRDLAAQAEGLLAPLNIQVRFRSSLRELLTLADPDRITDLLLSLLSNSVKAIGTGGHIELALEKRNDNAVFLVTDDGGGVDSAALADFFDQAEEELDIPDHPTMKLGLPLARTIAALHGGFLLADNYAGQGVRQAASIPLKDCNSVRELKSRPVLQECGPNKVLVELSDCLPAQFYRPGGMDL